MLFDSKLVFEKAMLFMKIVFALAVLLTRTFLESRAVVIVGFVGMVIMACMWEVVIGVVGMGVEMEMEMEVGLLDLLSSA